MELCDIKEVAKKVGVKVAISKNKGAQWHSGRVLDSRPMGRGFEPHCVVSLSKTY